MNELDDRELEQYLQGGSPLSRRYRKAGGESPPPELDEAILARARAEARRKPGVHRYLAPVALAASLALAVNLAWNISRVEPVPGRAPAPSPAEVPGSVPSEYDAPMATPAESPASTPPAAPRREPAKAEEARAREGVAQPAPPPAGEARAKAAADASAAAERASAEPHALLERQVQAANRARLEKEQARAVTALAADAAAPAAALPEGVKVDRLIAYVAGLEGAVFIRNGKEYTPAEAAQHLAYKRDKAGDRAKTADDFIRRCASFSSVSGEAYLIRFADGRTRTAEDVLREELARLEGR